MPFFTIYFFFPKVTKNTDLIVQLASRQEKFCLSEHTSFVLQYKFSSQKYTPVSSFIRNFQLILPHEIAITLLSSLLEEVTAVYRHPFTVYKYTKTC